MKPAINAAFLANSVGTVRSCLSQKLLNLVVRPYLRAAVSSFGHYTGLSRLIGARYRGRGVIFALHSVVDEDALYLDQSLRCSTRQLEAALQWLREENSILSIWTKPCGGCAAAAHVRLPASP
jgi:hypothetical protein